MKITPSIFFNQIKYFINTRLRYIHLNLQKQIREGFKCDSKSLSTLWFALAWNVVTDKKSLRIRRFFWQCSDLRSDKNSIWRFLHSSDSSTSQEAERSILHQTSCVSSFNQKNRKSKPKPNFFPWSLKKTMLEHILGENKTLLAFRMTVSCVCFSKLSAGGC